LPVFVCADGCNVFPVVCVCGSLAPFLSTKAVSYDEVERVFTARFF
jgi:hypothetical protein